VLDLEDTGEFLGVHRHSMDTKGRLVLPAQHRELLEEGLVMTIGFENSLSVYTLTRWNEVRATLREMKPTDAAQRGMARMIASQAERTSLDKQGRVTIPQRLRAYAKLTKDCAVIGVEQHAEIWDSERWDDYERRSLEDLSGTDTTFNIGIF
jgi:MraZ protein